MSEIRFLSHSDVVKALPMPDAIEGMKVAYGALSAGDVDMPLRSRLTGQKGGVSLIMPAHLTKTGDMAVKVASVFPENLPMGLPTIHALVLVLHAETGQLLAMLEGASLTAIRTGAGAGAATDILAKKDASTVAIIGSGVQARTQLEAVCAVRDIKQVRVYSSTRENAEKFAAKMSGKGMIPALIDVEDSANSAIEDADIICTATTASSPVFDGKLLKPGTHINAVGSFTPTMQEVDEVTLQKARICVDSRESVLEEAGEIIIAIKNGAIAESDLYAELGEILNDKKEGRQSADEITYFKSCGVAVQDAIAASIALKNAEAMTIGTLLDMDS